jgi:hypothetical protein
MKKNKPKSKFKSSRLSNTRFRWRSFRLYLLPTPRLGKGGTSLSFTYAKTDTSTETLDIKKSTDQKITIPGPSLDGLDHGHDLIYLWLNPEISLALTSSSGEWTFSGPDKAIIRALPVSWLRDPSCRKDDHHLDCIPDDVREDLRKYGINESDWAGIVQRDPLANADPSAPLDPKRFVSLNFTYGYYPPVLPTDPVQTLTKMISTSKTSTNETKATEDFKVALTLSAEGDFLGVAKVSLKNTDTWDWTYTSSKTDSAGTSESSTVTIGAPGYNYPQTAPTNLSIYFDTIYKTFAFTLDRGQPIALKGTLVNANRKPISGADISLVVNNVMHRTFTNLRGEWRFPGIMNGPCEIQFSGISKKLPECSIRDIVKLQLNQP